MNSTIRNFSLAAAVVAVGLGGAIGYQAVGAAIAAGQPTVVVTLNLAKVLENLDQRGDSAARMNKMKADMEAEDTRRRDDIEKFKTEAVALQTEYESSTDATRKQAIDDRMQVIQEEAAFATLQYQAWVSFSSDKIDIEAALVMKDLYRSVKMAAAQMATTNGYDMVLVDDSQGELTFTSEARVSRVDQVRQQIAARRMLHVNPTIDITDELIQRMNNARKAAGPSPAP